jgi:5-methylcytosine-specific restriction enzyme A
VAGSLVEKRRYRLHLRIERAVGASRKAKKYHGTRCQGCDTKLSERYGAVAAGLIEAHHLRPISSLEEGAPVTYVQRCD